MTGAFTINGREVTAGFGAAETLLDVLRRTGHTEVKRGCSRGECGACLVLLDDELVNSCQVYAATAIGRRVTTSAGLAAATRTEGRAPAAHAIHQSFAETGAVQCGFCTPGMVMAAWWLLSRNNDPSEEEIREALVGNLCRCTGYVKIVEAVRLAAERMRNHG